MRLDKFLKVSRIIKRRPIAKIVVDGKKPYKMVYCEDLFGNIIEIYTHSYELHYGSGSY